MLSISREARDYVGYHMILAKIFLKKCANNFSQKADYYLKERIVMYKNSRYKFKKVNKFCQSLKIGLIYK